MKQLKWIDIYPDDPEFVERIKAWVKKEDERHEKRSEDKPRFVLGASRLPVYQNLDE